MNVVDLAQAGERAAGGEIERHGVMAALRSHRRAKIEQRLAFLGGRARDPGADRVDEMELDQRSRCIRDARARRHMLAELLERGHGVASGEHHISSLPCSCTAIIADTMAQSPRSPETPTRRL